MKKVLSIRQKTYNSQDIEAFKKILPIPFCSISVKMISRNVDFSASTTFESLSPPVPDLNETECSYTQDHGDHQDGQLAVQSYDIRVEKAQCGGNRLTKLEQGEC